MDDSSRFGNRLDRTDDVLTSLGLVLSGAVFAAGIAGLLFVLLRVASTTPPSFGSQGEWLYAAVACILVAGWGFGRAATFYARRRRAAAWDGSTLLPKVRLGPDGFTIEMKPPPTRNAGDADRHTWNWSFNSEAVPLKTIELTEAQISAADGVAGAEPDWDRVARQVTPEYAVLSAFEQRLYRHALQTSVENRRRKHSP